jgi:hypothetical protein
MKHFSRRLVGKSGKKNGIRRHTLLYKIRHPVGYRAGLPTPRPGNDEHRPITGKNNLPLFLVEFSLVIYSQL